MPPKVEPVKTATKVIPEVVKVDGVTLPNFSTLPKSPVRAIEDSPEDPGLLAVPSADFPAIFPQIQPIPLESKPSKFARTFLGAQPRRAVQFLCVYKTLKREYNDRKDYRVDRLCKQNRMRIGRARLARFCHWKLLLGTRPQGCEKLAKSSN